MDYKIIGNDKSFKTIGAINTGNDTLFLNRDLAVSNHVSAIGSMTENALSAQSVADGTNWTNVGTQQIATIAAGTWLLICSMYFQQDQDGNRAVRWYNQTDGEYVVASEVIVPACSGTTTRVQSVCVVKFTSGSKQFVPQVWQTAGTSLNVTPRFQMIRLA